VRKSKREAPGDPEASPDRRSALHGVSGDPFLGLMGHGDERLKVAETERGAVVSLVGLILEKV